MRQFSEDLSHHLSGTVTTLCQCWLVRRKDETTLGFTDHDRDIRLGEQICRAATGFQPSQAVSELGLSVDNQEIQGAFSSIEISERDLEAGLYDGARVETWLVNWNDPNQNHLMHVALLGEVVREDNLFRAQLQGQADLLSQNTARSYGRNCDAQLGDGRCSVNVNTPEFRVSGSVRKVLDRLSFECVGLSGFEPGWFSHGQLTWTSGDNNKLQVELSGAQGDSPDTLILWKAMPFAPSVGDAFEVVAGCDKSFATCKAKFGNAINFRGFPHIPGTDFALGYAQSETVHDGGPLIR